MPSSSSSSSKSKSKSSRSKNPCHEEDMVDRLAKIEYDNPHCADCPTSCPRWVSFLRDHHAQEEGERKHFNVEGKLCVVICDDCAIQHHKVLSKTRCMIKCLECVHEWTHEEVDTVLASGNEVTNRLYEAGLMLTKAFIASEGLLDNFIRQKYRKYKFRDDDLMEEFLYVLEKKGIQKARKRLLEPDSKSRRKTWTTTSSSSSSRRKDRSRSSSTTSDRTSDNDEVAAEEPSRSSRSRESSSSSRCDRDTSSSRPRRVSAPALVRPNASADASYKKNRRVSRSSRISRQRVSKAVGRMTAFSASLSSKASLASTAPSTVTVGGGEEDADYQQRQGGERRVPSSIAGETASVSSLGLVSNDVTERELDEEEYYNVHHQADACGGDADECSSRTSSAKSVTWADDSFLVYESDGLPANAEAPLRRVHTDPGQILKYTNNNKRAERQQHSQDDTAATMIGMLPTERNYELTFEDGNSSLPCLTLAGGAPGAGGRPAFDRASSWGDLNFDIDDISTDSEDDDEEDGDYDYDDEEEEEEYYQEEQQDQKKKASFVQQRKTIVTTTKSGRSSSSPIISDVVHNMTPTGGRRQASHAA